MATSHILHDCFSTVDSQDIQSGLYFHGANAANDETSCCFWSRANGWQLMSSVEVMLAVAQVLPGSPLLAQLHAGFKRHVDAMAAVQVQGDGRFHQVLLWVERSLCFDRHAFFARQRLYD